jgi:hypothetical protein
MRVLITGATGLLGAEIVRQCRAAGWDTLGTARTPPPDSNYAPMDITDPDMVRATVDAFRPDSFLDDPRPEGREPIPAERVPMLVSVFEQTEAVTVALAFTVRAEGVMQSDATFGVWLDESLAHEDKLETMRQLAARLHPIVNPDYYLDLMLITPRDAMLWQMATENGDPIFARDEEDIQAQLHLLQTLPPISDDERDIDVMRVM